MSYRCANDLFLYCESPDHVKLCDDIGIKKGTIFPCDVKCDLDPNVCTFSLRNSEVVKEDPRLASNFKSLLFPDMEGQPKKEEKKTKKKAKPEVVQGTFI